MNFKKNVTDWLIIILLVCVSLISLSPLWWLIRSSLMTPFELFEFPPKLLPKVFKWGNYLEVFDVLPIWLFLKNTMLIMIPVIIGTVLTSCLSGYAFARLAFPLRSFWFALILSTMMIPFAVTLIPTFILWTKLGLMNTFWPLIAPAWFGGSPFFIFLMRQFFMSIPKDLEEAALIDGAGYLRIFRSIFVPLVVPALIVVTFFTFMGVWNDFFGPLIFLNNEKKFTLALGLLQLKSMYSTNWNVIMAASVIMVIPAIIVFFFGQKHFVEGVNLTGIKG